MQMGNCTGRKATNWTSCIFLRCAQVLSEAGYNTSKANKKDYFCVRDKLQRECFDKCDKILDFTTFAEEFERRFTSFSVRNHGEKLIVFMVDKLGSKVVQYFCFKKVESCFWFLHLSKVEKNGYEIPKIIFDLQKNSLFHRWSQMEEILSIVNNDETSNNDHLLKAIEELKQMTIDVQESTHFQFLETQREFLLILDNNIRYTKYLPISVQLHYLTPPPPFFQK